MHQRINKNKVPPPFWGCTAFPKGRRYLLLFFISLSAFAADPLPGDACSVNNSRIRSGGPETSGVVYDMTCQSSVWVITMTLAANSNVGIGTTSPNAKLDVKGSIVVPRIDNGGYYNVYHSGSTYQIAGLNTSNDTVFGPPASNTVSRMKIATTGVLSLEANSKEIVFANNALGAENARITGAGNFGIGTTAPAYLLEVAGQINSTGTLITIGGNSGLNRNGNNLILRSAGGDNVNIANTHFGFSSGMPLAWSSSTVYTGRDIGLSRIGAGVLGVGNGTASDVSGTLTAAQVGVGTTSPNSPLTVQGVMSLAETSAPTSAANYGKIYVKSSDSKLYFMDDAGAETDLIAGGPASAVAASAGTAGSPSISFSGDPDTGLFSAGTNLLGITTNGTEKMRVTAAGRVGIGTTMPTAFLDVNGNSNFNGTMTMNNNTITGVDSLTISDVGPNEGLSFSSASANGYSIDVTPLDRSNADGNLNLYGTGGNIALWRPVLNVFNSTNYTTTTPQAAGGVDITTTGSGNITFNPGGNVGIGTTSPGGKLNVYGNSSLGSGTYSALRVNGYQLTANTGAYYGIYLDPYYNASSGNTLNTLRGLYANPHNSWTGTVTSLYGAHFQPENSNSGTVGTMYGFVSEPSKTGTGAITSMYGIYTRCINSNATGTINNCYGMYIDTPVTTGAITTKFALYQPDSASTNYLNGNVGIGTTSPAAKLDVNGSVSLNSSYEGMAAYTNSGAGYTIPDTTQSIRRITLNSNTTITLPAFTTPANKVYTLTIFLQQDGTGNRTVAWAGNGGDTIKWDSGVAPTISATANKISVIQLFKASDESFWYGSMTWREN